MMFFGEEEGGGATDEKQQLSHTHIVTRRKRHLPKLPWSQSLVYQRPGHERCATIQNVSQEEDINWLVSGFASASC